MSHFSLARNLGLYEDDYSFISPAFSWGIDQLWRHILDNFRFWPQGRPIGFSLPPLLSFIGYRLGELYGIYIIGFLILSINAFLVYALLKKINSPESLALLAGLAFSIFPADTTRSFLMHATGLEPSLTFLLIASLCYFSGRKTLSYIVIIGSLLTYESPFMIFFGIPLLQSKCDRKFAAELVRHVVALSLMLLCVFGIRYLMNDSRVHMGSDIFFIPPKIILSLIIGPLVSIGLFLYAPVVTVSQFSMNVMVTFAVCLLAVGWFLSRTNHDTRNAIDVSQLRIVPWLVDRLNKVKISPEYWQLIHLSLVGIVLLCLAYTLSFTHFPPIKYHGRLTSVHLAASVGSSILFACLATSIMAIARHYRLKLAGIGAVVLYVALTAGYGVLIQENYATSWRIQKCFWTRVTALTPDMQDGTTIFFEYDGVPLEPMYADVFSWADPIILEQIYDFSPTWKYPPRLFTVKPNWAQYTFLKDGQIMWNVPTTTRRAHSEALPESNLVLLQMVNRSLLRIENLILVQDQVFPLKWNPQTSTNSFMKGPLYNLLIIETTESCPEFQQISTSSNEE